MVVEQEFFKLVPKVPAEVATVTAEGSDPFDAFDKTSAIYVNFGKQKNGNVIEYAYDIIFESKEKAFKIKQLHVECGCTKASSVITKKDGNIELVLRYNSKRIGIQDKDDFRKGIQLETDKGRMNFVLLISETKQR